MTSEIVETIIYYTCGLYLLTTRVAVRRQYYINQRRVENIIY